MRKLLVLLALTAMVVLAGACGSSGDGGSSAKKEPAHAEGPTAVETVQVAYKETAAEFEAALRSAASRAVASSSPSTPGPADFTKGVGCSNLTAAIEGNRL